MAARWGAGEETCTIAGMELFPAGGPLQCDALEEHEPCVGLADLSLSSLDSGILGSFHGYLENSIISIIDDTGAQAENKGHFDEDNELSLLTALTEILDNAEDENMSPFDSIPDSELLASPKDRDGSSLQRLLNLSRTPPEIPSLDDHRRLNFAKMERCPGPNWDLFPDSLSSTPKRRTRRRSIRVCFPRKTRIEPSQQRSDGEEEEVRVPGESSEQIPKLIGFEDNFSLDPDDDISDNDRIMKHGTPYIINTENVALNDLVKYMHPYCLPALTVCLEPDDRESLLGETVFLEIVSDQGETVQVPIIMEQPGDLLNDQPSEDLLIPETLDNLNMETQTLCAPQSTLEQCVPESNGNEKIDLVEDSELQEQSAVTAKEDQVRESVPELKNMSTEPLISKETVDQVLNEAQTETAASTVKENQLESKAINEQETVMSISDPEKASLKGKKSNKDKRPKSSKLKCKSKNKEANEKKPQEGQVTVPAQSITQTAASQPSHPSLQESDLLIKTLDQLKRESQMDLRTSKLTRYKAKSRLSLDNPEKKMIHEDVKEDKITEQPKIVVDLEMDNGTMKNAETAEGLNMTVGFQEPAGDEKVSSQDDSADVSEGASNVEVKESAEEIKEIKPKSLSLSEYRKRLQNRRPIAEKENENSSCSKWPSIPEPPTELAEIPCLIMPANNKKAVVERKPSPSKTETSLALDVPIISGPTVPIASVTNQETPINATAEKICPTAFEANPTPLPVIPSQPNIPPPFLAPPWPTVPSHPAFYPGLPPLPAVSQFPNTLPPMMPIQPPPPVMAWPPFPPPPIPMGPVPPNGWVTGLPPPYWPNPQVPQGMPETAVPFSVLNQHILPDQTVPHIAPGPTLQCHSQVKPTLVQKPESSKNMKKVRRAAETQSVKSSFENLTSPSKYGPRACSEVKKSVLSPSPVKAEVSVSPESKTSIPDLKSANQLVNKIMEILKKAQQCGFQIHPPLPVSQTPGMPSGSNKPSEIVALKRTEPEKTKSGVVGTQAIPRPVEAKPSTILRLQTKPKAAAKELEDKLLKKSVVCEQQTKVSVHVPKKGCSMTEGASNLSVASVPKEEAESFTCDTGIEASDLTSLLEEFEKSEVKDEECLPPSPDKLAVGNSGSEKPLDKKIPFDKHLAPELASTAGLTPPATPPHQLWKSVSGSLTGKSKTVYGNVQEKPCSSPLKTTMLIDAKPLPQVKHRSRNLGPAPSVAMPPIHVASGDHDYCILSASHMEKDPPMASEASLAAQSPPSQKEEGSRWNVKHHPNIIIKPIVPFNKRPPKLSVTSAPSVAGGQSQSCGGSEQPVEPCRNAPKDSNEPLDHRTNNAKPAGKSPPASVLMSPDSSPCRSEPGESRTDDRRENASVSRRSLRCYRKHRDSPSPQKSTWRRSSSGSCSDSDSSASSSGSRSRSPPSKRRKTYRSRGRHRSRSSSRSGYESSSSCRSSSGSSCPSCSPSSSRSRSRSRSPYRRRYRSRSRRCESREAYYRRRMYHKERAIEERRVVYVGKINSQMTRTELRRRFSIFGEIEECTIHFREEGDNYGFVTYRCTGEAFAAIENGHKVRLPDEQPFDLCFGGRRQFCKSNYADLDSNRDDFDPAPVRSKFESLDFDTLLRQAQKQQRR